MSEQLDLKNRELPNGLFIEASAGTGKTFSVAAIIVREIAFDDSLAISEILVTTFTRSAAAELRDRIRRRLVNTARALEKGEEDASDEVLTLLFEDESQRQARINRLQRAIVEFDTTTISTIHAVCSKIITLAGDNKEMADEADQDRIIAEVVNDHLVAQSHLTPVLDEEKVKAVVKKLVGEPLTTAWFDPSGADSALMQRVHSVVTECVAEVEKKLQESPSFDYLIRRAHTIINGGAESVLTEFRKRYRYLIVDEAQDTDAQQWEIFRGIFPTDAEGDGRALISVGDPKQSIYKFRGADIDAYKTERDKGVTRDLGTNFRSDGAVVEGLNALFNGTTYGEGIVYQPVSVPEGHKGSQVKNVPPVEVVAVEATEQKGLAPVVALRVAHYLSDENKVLINVRDPKPGEEEQYRVRPKDIVVLVKSGPFGEMVGRELRRLKIPAVTTGTASVMQSETAEHWRVLLRALERISDAGRVRHVLSTPFFGVSLTSPAVRHDGFIALAQDQLAKWAEVLRKDGVAVLATEMLSDSGTIATLSDGFAGERRLTDFSHIVDLLNIETNGAGCSPTDALEAWVRIADIDAKSEVVSRRVESDASAVQIMTIHVSKGLEFPFVVVADMWNEEQTRDEAPVFRMKSDDEGESPGVEGRVVDIGYITGSVANLTTQRMAQEQAEEFARLLYVATTRAKHHVCVLKPSIKKQSVLDSRFNADVLAGASPLVAIRSEEEFPELPEKFAFVPTPVEEMTVAELPDKVVQTYRRTSFTGITEKQKGDNSVAGAHRGDVRGGTDEGVGLQQVAKEYSDKKTPLGVDRMPMARVPGGAHIGKMLHSIYEHVNPAHPELSDHVMEVSKKFVLGKLWDEHGDAIAQTVLLSLSTPLGGALGSHTLSSLGPENRVAEMSFEMALAEFSENVKVNHIGELLKQVLPHDDLLRPYADVLADKSFDIHLAGLINGSIDALLRVEDSPGNPQFFISDYKSNRLDKSGDSSLISAYSQERMMREMEHHHYPLQALIYGAAVYRYLRWRAPQIDADAAIAGFAYMFIRGMVGQDTPQDANGKTHGVLTWVAPSGLWAQLSDLLAKGKK